MPIDYIFGTDLGQRPQQPTLLDSLTKALQVTAGAEQGRGFRQQNNEFMDSAVVEERRAKAVADRLLIEGQGKQAYMVSELMRLKKEAFDDPETVKLLKFGSSLEAQKKISDLLQEMFPEKFKPTY